MLNRLRLAMLGTGPFAAPTFRALYGTGHDVVALITQPIRQKAGKKLPPVSPMRIIAAEHETPILDPENVNEPQSVGALARLHADLFVVADYGQILKPATLAAARLGGINLHGSLLPKYRGAAPINWAIYHGECETGVTVIHMTPRIDAGPCLAQASLLIDPDETAVDLEARLAVLGAPLVCRMIDALAEGNIAPLPQDPALATKAPRLKKEDGQIDWRRPAQAIKDQVRALEPWPKSFTNWLRTGHEPMRLILGKVAVIDRAVPAEPGEVVQADATSLAIAAGDGRAVCIQLLQPAGKRMLSHEEFLRGYPVQIGECFGSADVGAATDLPTT